MVSLRFAYVLIVSLLVIHCPLHSHASPFDVGERLEYEISWLGMPGGGTMMEIKDIVDIDGRPAYHIESRTWTNSFISTFFKVDDRIECLMDADDLSGVSLKVRLREGRHKVDKEILFDRHANKVTYVKNGRKSVHDVPPFIRDSLSSFYYVRSLDLEVGRDINFDTFSGGKLYKMTVKVLARETLKIDGEKIDTIKIQPLAKHNDVFKSKGDLFIWYTDDEFKVPVKIKSEIKIGYFTAKLINFKKGERYGYRSGTAGNPRLSKVQR